MKLQTLSIAEVLLIHSVVIDETGGIHGIRDEGLLQSAVQQIQQTFSGQELYPTIFDKAAALFLGLLKNHPFLDGNKRTATVALGVFLELNGYVLKLDSMDLADWVQHRAAVKADTPDTVLWIRAHTIKARRK